MLLPCQAKNLIALLSFSEDSLPVKIFKKPKYECIIDE